MTFFSIRMAWRETRAAWRHFLYFFVCIALGVGALVGVALFASNVERAVTREARGLMGGDMEVRVSRPMSDRGLAAIQSLAARDITATHVSELNGMAAVPAGRATQIIELKAVETGYPFYGELRVEPDRSLRELLAPSGGFGAVVQQSLLVRMGLSVGDRLKIGEAIFIITGLLRKEPDRAVNLFSLGPRVLISQEGLAAAQLIKTGSRVRERYLLKLPPTISPEPLVYELRGRLARDSARVIPYKEAQPQLRRFLDQLTRYLGLVGLTALFVGGIGVASSVQAFLREKLQIIAILKTLGADSDLVVRTYLLQALLLGTVGSLAGVALGLALQGTLPAFIASLFPAEQVGFQINLSATATIPAPLPILKGLAMGILTTLLFTLWPLLGIREIRPALIFRREVAPISVTQHATGSAGLLQWIKLNRLHDPFRIWTAVSIVLGLAGLTIWQAGSWKLGLLFTGGLVAAVASLHLAARVLVKLLALVRGPRSVAIRHAIGNLRRPGSQAAGMMVAIGIGVMVIVAVSLLERSLVTELGENRPVDAPTFFFIDIQPDQKDAFVKLIDREVPHGGPELTPLVRSRLHALDGKPIHTEESRDPAPSGQEGTEREGKKSWYFTREYVLTFLDQLPKDNTLIKGSWWTPGERPSRPLVSVEEDAARNLGLDLGSIVELDIQGTTVSAAVSSIRKVEWGNLSTNFYMILSPGALDGAPFTYVATVRVASEGEVPLQQAVVASFPNVTAINIGDVLNSFTLILERLSLAIRAVAVFCVLTGGIVMAGALAATRYRRLYESVVLKALGATRGLIARSFATEYALLGAAAGLIGIALANALAWAILHFVLDLSWTAQPAVLALGFVLTLILTLTVGFLSTFRILGQPPLAVLRQE
jgi:putative ABC transport system permease protein